jgi:hypothetical protein
MTNRTIDKMRPRKTTLIFFVAVLVINLLFASCGNTSSTSVAAIKSFQIIKTENYMFRALELKIMPLDKKGRLLNNISSTLIANVMLWNDQRTGILLQQWENIPITREDFQDNVGYIIVLNYVDFEPMVDQVAYIKMAVKAGDISWSSEAEVWLLESEH